MLFSTIQNQSKANELIERAKEIIENTKERIREAKEKLLEEAGKNDSIKERLNKNGLNKFQELIKKIKNEDSANVTTISITQFCEQIKPLVEKSNIEPLSIIELKQKKASTLFASFFMSLISIVLVVSIGAFATGVTITPETFTDMKVWQNILAWIGGGAYNPEIANPVWGIAALVFIAIVVGITTWSIMLSKTSKENLKISESMLEDAESYENKMNDIIEKMQNLTLSLQDYRKNLEIYDAYINEFNAIIHRILLTEGDDFENFKPASKAQIERATITVSAIIPHLNIAIITTDNKTADQLLQAIDDTKKLLEDLSKE